MSASKFLRRIGGPLVALLLLASFAIAPAASAVASRNGRWEGTNAQSEPFRFNVNNEQVVFVYTHVKIQGSACTVHVTWRARATVTIRDDGTFRAKFVSMLHHDNTLTVAGKFTAPRRASGTLRAVEGEGSCQGSVNTTWNVTKQ
jgi:hypothetical protein